MEEKWTSTKDIGVSVQDDFSNPFYSISLSLLLTFEVSAYSVEQEAKL